jgi:hypothetical protein
MADTLLVITPNGIAPYSARGLTQTYTVIAAAVHLERAVNGQLVDLSAPQMRKYASKISCKDQQTPSFGGLYPGMQVVVDCVFELSYLTANGTGYQDRTPVEGSVYTNGDYTVYRPQLTMLVSKAPEVEHDEWGREISWSLELEEL